MKRWWLLMTAAALATGAGCGTTTTVGPVACFIALPPSALLLEACRDHTLGGAGDET
jgi:hypothetical protein